MNDSLYILAFGAHPDDVEIGAAGILAKHAELGHAVGICNLTYAEMSTNGNPEDRQREAQQSAEILGVGTRLQLDLGDRRLRADFSAIDEVIDVIRACRPTIVLSPAATDRHPDHEWCCQIVREALFSAGLRKYQTRSGHAPFKPARFYQYMINHTHRPSLVVDVSSVYEKKRQALSAYKSQFLASGQSAATPLNQGTFLKSVEARDTLFGHEAGVLYAEGLLTEGPILLSAL